VELDPVDERVLVYRPGVRGALPERLAVGLAGSSDVLPSDRRERDEFDGIDLNLTESNSVAAAPLDPRPLPQPDRERDVSGEDVATQFGAELHAQDGSPSCGPPGRVSVGEVRDQRGEPLWLVDHRERLGVVDDLES
jgi:hypothetical protein